jgi:hypothetical protein
VFIRGSLFPDGVGRGESKTGAVFLPGGPWIKKARIFIFPAFLAVDPAKTAQKPVRKQGKFFAQNGVSRFLDLG